MSSEAEGTRRGLSRTEKRFVLAALTAFLLPGLILWVGAVLFPVQSFPEARPQSPSDWALLLPGSVAGGALFGSPLIVLALIAWRILHRRHLASAWAFGVIGTIAGVSFPLILGGRQTFMLIEFAAAGLLTGFTVWNVAYLQTK